MGGGAAPCSLGTGKELVLLRHERFGLDLKKDFLTTEVDGESTSFTY